MATASVKVPSASGLLLAVLLAGCGGDAQSAADDGSLRLAAAEEPAGPTVGPVEDAADPAGPAAPEAPAETAAGGGDAPEAAVYRPVPASRPATSRPAPRPATERPAEGPAEAELPVEPAPEPVVERERPSVAAGRTLELRMVGKLSTSENGAGDAFTARVTDDVLAPDGMVLIPAGAQVRGRVAEARQSTGSEDPAVLRLEVVGLVHGGRTVPLAAVVTDVEMQAEARDSDRRTAAKIGVGAAAGAVVGQILGKDRESTLKGAAAGAVAGTAAALATRSGHATIEEGARLTIRLTQRLVVE